MLLVATLKASAPALLVLLFFSFIGMIFFGALVFVIEEGDFLVTSDYPDGAFLRRTTNEYSYEISPFTSITAAMYWVITTGTTGEATALSAVSYTTFPANKWRHLIISKQIS